MKRERPDVQDLFGRLEAFRSRHLLADIDVQLAHALARLAPDASADVLLAAALASRAVQQGHVCVDLAALAGQPLTTEGEEALGEEALPSLSAWLACLRDSTLVAPAPDDRAPRPLVLDARGRLYLFRYARYQRWLAEALNARAGRLETVDVRALRAGLARLFPEGASDEQRLAVAVAVVRNLSVISGGPGTGKTFTVARLLALLQELAWAEGGPLRVLALAPTGKAAQRLGESMAAAVASLDCAPAVRECLLAPTSTIHRALGFLPQTPTRFRHDAHNPLPADVVLVDEASMVDLALMAKLVVAVPPHARLVLLGDKDQLASVEAGSILADIAGEGASPGVSAAMAARLGELGLTVPVVGGAPGLADGCILLTRSRRYDPESGIGALARAVNAGDAAAAVAVAEAGRDVRLLPQGPGLHGRMVDDVRAVFAGLRSLPPRERLTRLSRFKILCAHRKGPHGAEQVNRDLEALLVRDGSIDASRTWYDGRPLLVTANDPVLELWNGDVGIVCVDPVTGVPLAHFAGAEGQGTRAFAPARLPPHETVFAMTVHKSQGSEFEHVALLLPDKPSAVLTRELVYTAITRARRRVDIYGAAEVLAAAITRRVQRASGLRDALS
ncbi:MAG: exodeoxyribonuclease V subunit alpha [Myxococcales bacterium]|nr:exodeoxyribonuclease V subunit alpha [Myxococcales bacterium]